MTDIIKNTESKKIRTVGIDIGSTTTKMAVLDTQKNEVQYSAYRRHHADQAGSVVRMMEELESQFPKEEFYFSLTGSGANPSRKL